MKQHQRSPPHNMSTIISSLIIIAIIIGLFHLPLLSLAIEIQTDESKRIILIREDSNEDGAATNGGAFSLQIGGVLFSPSNNNEQWRVHLSNICRQQHDHSQDKEVEVACQYDAMLQRVQSTAIVEMNRLKSSSFHNNHDDDHDEEERDYTGEIEYNTATIEQLSPLASFHKWQLDNADALGLAFATTTDDDELSNDNGDDFMSIGKMHYHRSLGTLLSSEYYHTITWTLLQREETIRKREYSHLYDEYNMNIIPSVYERHAISQGAIGVALQLSDLYYRYYALYHDDDDNEHYFDDNNDNANEEDDDEERIATKIREGYSLSYRYLLIGEHWCHESQTLLNSLDFVLYNNDDSDGGTTNEEQSYKRQRKQQHEMYVNVTTQSCAHVHVRLGTLLLNMYGEGYTLTAEEMLSYNPYAAEIVLLQQQQTFHDGGNNNIMHDEPHYPSHVAETIKADQERLLHSIIQRFQTGLAVHNTNDQDRGDLATTHHHFGLTYQYLGDYKSAISEWKQSLNINRELFNEYKQRDDGDDDGMISSSIQDIVTSLITVSQLCCDALLSLGHYEESIELYGLNLKLRRYLYDETPIETDLSDQDVNSMNYEDMLFHQDDDYLSSLYDTKTIDESIHEHTLLLNEYYKHLSDNPHGSYHDALFDVDGSGIVSHSMTISDNVYEGSLRSVIGSLYLAKNDVRMAQEELERAVSLLRNGIEEEANGMWEEPAQDADGNVLSLPLYLADALLNLSYAQSGMGQWLSSLMSFREALDIYEKELLSEDSSPFGRKDDGESIRTTADPVKKKRDSLFETLKAKFSVHIGTNDWEGVDNSTTVDGGVHVEL
eukprot:scaffold39809_cov88-Cyclotella_meneghiniana.AAC.3